MMNALNDVFTSMHLKNVLVVIPLHWQCYGTITTLLGTVFNILPLGAQCHRGDEVFCQNNRFYVAKFVAVKT